MDPASLPSWKSGVERSEQREPCLSLEFQVVRQLAGGLGVLACGPVFSACSSGILASRDLNNVYHIFIEIPGSETAGWWGLVYWRVALHVFSALVGSYIG